ncbi:MAG TPA: hypothetical protein VHN80_17640 [Kineosporiaceae bacterium]|nr:hypothetical protein [Kineosporiaceae bacterium]
MPATPASSQYLRASAVHSSETSQQTNWPSSGSASATAVDEYPVKVPISMHRRAPISSTSMARKAS